MGWPLRSCSGGWRGDGGRATSGSIGRIPSRRHQRDGDEDDLPRYGAADSCLYLHGLWWTAGLLHLFIFTDGKMQGHALLHLFFEGDLQVLPPLSCLYLLFSLSLSRDPHVPAAIPGYHGSTKKTLVQVNHQSIQGRQDNLILCSKTLLQNCNALDLIFSRKKQQLYLHCLVYIRWYLPFVYLCYYKQIIFVMLPCILMLSGKGKENLGSYELPSHNGVQLGGHFFPGASICCLGDLLLVMEMGMTIRNVEGGGRGDNRCNTDLQSSLYRLPMHLKGRRQRLMKERGGGIWRMSRRRPRLHSHYQQPACPTSISSAPCGLRLTWERGGGLGRRSMWSKWSVSRRKVGSKIPLHHPTARGHQGVLDKCEPGKATASSLGVVQYGYQDCI